jgi:hypothetical protein
MSHGGVIGDLPGDSPKTADDRPRLGGSLQVG